MSGPHMWSSLFCRVGLSVHLGLGTVGEGRQDRLQHHARALGWRPSGISSSFQESVLIWAFSTKEYVYGELYQNRARISNNAEQSDASITIDQLTMDDNGTYECSVLLTSDLGGVSKSRVYLLVLGECFLPPGVIGRGWGGWGVRRRHPGGKVKLEAMPNEELRLLPSSGLSGGLGGLLLPLEPNTVLSGHTAPQDRGQGWFGVVPGGHPWRFLSMLPPVLFPSHQLLSFSWKTY